MKKVITSKHTEMKKRRASEPVFWDRVEKPEVETDPATSFTGLK